MKARAGAARVKEEDVDKRGLTEKRLVKNEC